jgi:protein SCO1/2
VTTLSPASPHVSGPSKKGAVGRRTTHIPAPNFVLTDQDGKPFDSRRLRKKIALVTFLFTSCVDSCPILVGKLLGIQEELQKNRHSDFFFVGITTDPERDKPEVLNAYARRLGVDFRYWALLTGTRRDLAQVWDAFGVRVQKLSADQVQHTALTTLIDHKGIRRVDYLSDNWAQKEILKDIVGLTREN